MGMKWNQRYKAPVWIESTYIPDILILRIELVIIGEALRPGELSDRY